MNDSPSYPELVEAIKYLQRYGHAEQSKVCVKALYYLNMRDKKIDELNKKLLKIETNLLYMDTAAKNDVHRIAELEEALKPFAYYAKHIHDDVSDTASASGTVGDLRQARKVLGEKG